MKFKTTRRPSLHDVSIRLVEPPHWSRVLLRFIFGR